MTGAADAPSRSRLVGEIRHAGVGYALALLLTLVALAPARAVEAPSSTDAAKPTADQGTVSGASAATTTSTSVTPVRRQSTYRFIVERNIFLRTHRSNDNSSRSASQPKPQWILTGVVLQNTPSTAIFENSLTGAAQPVAVGDTFNGGKITAIAEAGVAWESQGTVRRILVGASLSGDSATLPAAGTAATTDNAGSASTSGAGGGTSGGGGGASGGSAAQDAILEKLRARRAQEMNR